jgi:hypothetical protein
MLWPHWPGVLAWTLSALFVLGMGATAWLDHLLRQAGPPELALFTAASAAVVLVYALNFSGAPVPLLALALLLTPTGSLPSRRWRWVAAALVAVAVGQAIGAVFERRPLEPPLLSGSPLAIDTLAGPLLVRLHELAAGVIELAFVLAIVAGAGSLLMRFRRARGYDRNPGTVGRRGRGRDSSSTPGMVAKATAASHSRTASVPLGGGETSGPCKPTGGSRCNTSAGVPTPCPTMANASAIDRRIGSSQAASSAAAA